MPIEIDPVKRARRPRRVSKKTTKTPTAKQKQLQKLKDMRDKVMGTKKVMTAAMGGQAKASKKRAMTEKARRGFAEILKKGPGKPKVAMPRDKMKQKGLAGLMAGAAKTAGKTAGKGLKGALAKLTLKNKLKSRKAAEAFKKAKARKPSGRLTADDLRRATRRR